MLERLFILRYMWGSSKASVVKTIALLSVFGVSLGVLAMVVVLSVMGGFDSSIKNRLLGAEPHLIVKSENMGQIQKIIGSSGTTQRYSKQDVVLRTGDGIFSGAVAQGEEAVELAALAKRVRHHVEVTDNGTGAMATSRETSAKIDFLLGPREVAVGVDLARSLGIFEDDDVSIVAPESLLLPAGEIPIYEKAHVRALVRTDVPEIDAHVVFYNVDGGLRRLRDTASLEKGIEIKLENPEDAPYYAKLLKKAGLKDVKTWEDLNSSLFYSLKMEKTLMELFLGLTILVSSFSIVGVLVLLVTEKRTDVGILKAIGATQNQIRSIFMSIGLALGMVGILSGVFFGLVICWVLKTYPIIRLPDIYYDTSIPVNVEKGVIFGVIILGAILSLAGTAIPAIRVARYSPMDAIRHDDN
jgi:lipoprotein-releasing system permease protein